eukprot:COSAG06_NODE_306_length_17801_cov_6.989210_4_plen_446_part_00
MRPLYVLVVRMDDSSWWESLDPADSSSESGSHFGGSDSEIPGFGSDSEIPGFGSAGGSASGDDQTDDGASSAAGGLGFVTWGGLHSGASEMVTSGEHEFANDSASSYSASTYGGDSPRDEQEFADGGDDLAHMGGRKGGQEPEIPGGGGGGGGGGSAWGDRRPEPPQVQPQPVVVRPPVPVVEVDLDPARSADAAAAAAASEPPEPDRGGSARAARGSKRVPRHASGSSAAPSKRSRRPSEAAADQRQRVETAAGHSIEWDEVHEMLLHLSGPLAAEAKTRRPHLLERTMFRQIFVERPRLRRKPSGDKWLNSGGKKGSTVHWISTDIAIRKRYGKCIPVDNGDPIKFMEFSLVRNQANPIEDKSIVAFVLEGPPPPLGSYIHPKIEEGGGAMPGPGPGAISAVGPPPVGVGVGGMEQGLCPPRFIGGLIGPGGWGPPCLQQRIH